MSYLAPAFRNNSYNSAPTVHVNRMNMCRVWVRTQTSTRRLIERVIVNWQLLPALVAAAVMTLFGLGALMRPTSLGAIGISADSALGTSEIRSVFGGMFVALGVACLITREPVVFGVVGAAWLADVAVRVVSVVVDRVPARQALAVLAIGGAIGGALVSGYWLA